MRNGVHGIFGNTTMIGRLIIDSIMAAVNPVKPVGRLNRFCTKGDSSARPMKPIITEGKPASNSIIGLVVSRTFTGATSAR